MKKIGKVVTFTGDVPIQTCLKGKVKTVKKSDMGFLDKEGRFHVMSGEAYGDIIITDEEVSGYAVNDITKLIFISLNKEFGLREILKENDIEVEEFNNAIFDFLTNIL